MAAEAHVSNEILLRTIQIIKSHNLNPLLCNEATIIIKSIIDVLEHANSNGPKNDIDLVDFINTHFKNYSNKVYHSAHYKGVGNPLERLCEFFIIVINNIIELIHTFNNLSYDKKDINENEYNEYCHQFTTDLPCLEGLIDSIHLFIQKMNRPLTPPPPKTIIASTDSFTFVYDGGFSEHYTINKYEEKLNKICSYFDIESPETAVRTYFYYLLILAFKCCCRAFCTLGIEEARKKCTNSNFERFLEFIDFFNKFNRYTKTYEELKVMFHEEIFPITPASFTFDSCEALETIDYSMDKKYLLYGETRSHRSGLDKDVKHLYLKYKSKYLTLKKYNNFIKKN